MKSWLAPLTGKDALRLVWITKRGVRVKLPNYYIIISHGFTTLLPAMDLLQ